MILTAFIVTGDYGGYRLKQQMETLSATTQYSQAVEAKPKIC